MVGVVVPVAEEGNGEQGHVVPCEVGVRLAPPKVARHVHRAHDAQVKKQVDAQHHEHREDPEREEEEPDKEAAENDGALSRRRTEWQLPSRHGEQVRRTNEDREGWPLDRRVRILRRVGIAMMQPVDGGPDLGISPDDDAEVGVEDRRERRVDPKGVMGKAAVAVDLGNDRGEDGRAKTNQYWNSHAGTLAFRPGANIRVNRPKYRPAQMPTPLPVVCGES